MVFWKSWSECRKTKNPFHLFELKKKNDIKWRKRVSRRRRRKYAKGAIKITVLHQTHLPHAASTLLSSSVAAMMIRKGTLHFITLPPTIWIFIFIFEPIFTYPFVKFQFLFGNWAFFYYYSFLIPICWIGILVGYMCVYVNENLRSLLRLSFEFCMYRD